MKKTMQLLLISILATVLLFSVTVLVSQILMERVYKSSYNTSSVYKVVDFTPPNKTVYTLDEINSYIPNDDNIVQLNEDESDGIEWFSREELEDIDCFPDIKITMDYILKNIIK